ncbi:hypothetical protein GGTG_04295 [Gaeumannomyces tritici R3-111a-1]|uniref:Uncharacterized protein n=1 Tax=Gaeumannomyces tritici (strain R3-111a-1) TaxID=644352 RepID=J3NSP6_GAET3|nr:hypothetical protein GGTG_04295 [Gaeumannomyces tritici R3-111a-1]EJT79209.1 hypothetical protein GGTG_04295 [Gaeumannomyces tritici R3-111a-1]
MLSIFIGALNLPQRSAAPPPVFTLAGRIEKQKKLSPVERWSTGKSRLADRVGISSPTYPLRSAPFLASPPLRVSLAVPGGEEGV